MPAGKQDLAVTGIDRPHLRCRPLRDVAGGIWPDESDEILERAGDIRIRLTVMAYRLLAGRRQVVSATRVIVRRQGGGTNMAQGIAGVWSDCPDSGNSINALEIMNN